MVEDGRDFASVSTSITTAIKIDIAIVIGIARILDVHHCQQSTFQPRV